MGSLVQVDGSIHDWFEGRGALCCLFVYVDDASNNSYFRFSDQETIKGGLTSMRRYIDRNGIAEQFYLDKKNIYRNPGKLTQFARAAAALGTEMIYANSPQAKGRVERANRTHQDRLVKALRERNISTIEEANRFLEEEYIDAHNARFAKTEELEDLHRPVGELDLNNIICIEEKRNVNHDMTFQFEGVFYQILPTKADRPIPRQDVVVRRWLDDSLHAFWREQELDISRCEERPRKQPPHTAHPPENHPWRHSVPIGKARRRSISELCRKPR